MTKLNIGAGKTKIEGFTPIDRLYGTEAYPLNYADNSVDEIRASHILEHFSFGEAHQALCEWVRVLKPGGRIRIAVPDLDKIGELKNDPKQAFYLMGGQTDENDFHRSAWTRQSLSDAMQRAGLTDIAPWSSSNTDCAALPVSLNLEAVKGEKVNNDIRIAAVTSIPRVGWNDHWGCVQDAMRPFGIPVRRFTGAFWGQHMQDVLNTCVRDDLDWIITLDYDTVFTAHDLDRLFGVFGRRPDIDALAAMQVGRQRDVPLMTVRGHTGITTDGSPIKANTAHFGLTLLRVDALRRVPKPWFFGLPNDEGEWNNEGKDTTPDTVRAALRTIREAIDVPPGLKVDPDIWFWKQWERAGNTLYVDPQTIAGHLEVMVADMDDDLNPQRIHVTEWRKRAEQRMNHGNRNTSTRQGDQASEAQEAGEYARTSEVQGPVAAVRAG